MKLSVYVVGSNPLPILIALCYDLKLVEGVPNDHARPSYILFVCSEQTKKYADNCVNWLANKLGSGLPEHDYLILSHVHNAADINQKVYKKLGEICLSSDGKFQTLLLNNTGGTKVMSVTTTMTMIKFANERKMAITEIDVDPEKKQIIIHDPRTPEREDPWPDLDTKFKGLITLDDIVTLYGYEFKGMKKFEYTLGDRDKTLSFGQEIFSHLDAYKDFMKAFFGYSDIFKQNHEIRKLKASFPSFSLLNGWVSLAAENENNENNVRKFFTDKKPDRAGNVSYDVFICCEGAFREFLKDHEVITIDNCCNKCAITEEYLKFLTGIWFEEYIYAVIEEILEEENKGHPQYEMINSFEIHPKGESDVNFEIDIAFRNGITVTYISCTTDETLTLVNKKFIEVLANADSIGLRTQVVLITLSKASNESVERRFSMFQATEYRKAKALGMVDVQKIATLKNKLKKLLGI